METTQGATLSPLQESRRRFRRDPWAMIPAVYLILVVMLAVFAPVLSPDKSVGATEQFLQARGVVPGARCNFVEGSSGEWIRYTKSERSGDSVVFYRGDLPVGAFVAGEEPVLLERRFWLGTDSLGRDMLSRLMWGARVSLGIGAMAVLLSLCIGMVIGSISGLKPGRTDSLLQALTNLVWAIPTLLLVVVITLFLGKGPLPVFTAVGLSMWVEVSRLVRGEVRTLAGQDFVVAARSLGYTRFRTLRQHIWPQLTGPILVVAASNFAGAILIESGLSFMGLGIQPPWPSWGNMVEAHRIYLLTDNPWPVLLPGIAIVSLVLAFTLLGDGIRRAVSQS
jgi:ABC-type dipeptide/oligopeptide/nickel transport system permease subunit